MEVQSTKHDGATHHSRSVQTTPFSIALGEEDQEDIFQFTIDEDGDLEEQFHRFIERLQLHGYHDPKHPNRPSTAGPIFHHQVKRSRSYSVMNAQAGGRRIGGGNRMGGDPYWSHSEAARVYRELFFNATDYTGLFRVNRPAQTEETSVEDVKDIKRMFEELILEIENSKDQLGSSLEEDLDIVVETLSTHMRQRLDLLRAAHERDISRVRRAYRAKLANSIAIMASEQEKERQKQLDIVQKTHEDRIKKLEERIFSFKKLSHHRSDELVKMRAHITRLQMAIKRNGLPENETGAILYQTIDDQRVKQSELLEYYQTALQARDDKIRYLQEQLHKQEETLKYKGDIRTVKLAESGHHGGEFSDVLMQTGAIKVGGVDGNVKSFIAGGIRMSRSGLTGPLTTSLGGGHGLLNPFGSLLATPATGKDFLAPVAEGARSRRASLISSPNDVANINTSSSRRPSAVGLPGSVAPQGSEKDPNLIINVQQPQAPYGVITIDIQATTIKKTDQVRSKYKERLSTMRQEHDKIKQSILDDIKKLDEEYKTKYEAIREESRKNLALKKMHANQNKVVLEMAKIFFPQEPPRGVSVETQCNMDADEWIEQRGSFDSN